jgi:hypothetical protein
MQKLSSPGSIGAANDHNERKMEVENADKDFKKYNQRLIGSGDLLHDVRERIESSGAKPQKDSVLAVEFLLTASPEFFNFRTEYENGEKFLRGKIGRWQEFERLSIEWLKEEYGKENLVSVTRHFDEGNPHLHAFIVPIVKKTVKVGRSIKREETQVRLSARDFFGKRSQLREMQTSIAEKMKPLGLVRGLEKSQAKHSEVRAFYGAMKEPEAVKVLKERVEQRVSIQKEAQNLDFKKLSIANEEKLLSERNERLKEENKKAEEEKKKIEEDTIKMKNQYAWIKQANDSQVKLKENLEKQVENLKRKLSNNQQIRH